MRIGIISDTHGTLPGRVKKIFTGFDLIYHAGDIGNPKVIKGLETICPVKAVYGNIDRWPLTQQYPAICFESLGKLSICLIHQIVSLKHFSFELFRRKKSADIVIYGHTHEPSFEHFNNIMFINPGSASNPRYSKKGSVAALDLSSPELAPQFFDIDL